MAELDASIPTTLGALVGAATFAAGFLSTRVHRQRDHALTIAAETDALADAAAQAGEPISPEVLHHQRRALNEVGNDWLDRVAGASVAVLAGSVVVLALVTARAQELGGSSPEGRLLTAFVVAALVVLSAALVDLVVARGDVRRRRAVSIPGLMDRSDRLWAGSGTVPEDRWTEALATATEAVRRSRGMYGPAWLVLGHTHLARLGIPRPPADTWLNARWALERATVLGPESAGLRWARAYLLEIGPEPDWEECVREWVRGCWLHHEATRPLARTDEVVERPAERGYRAVVVAEGGRLSDTLRFRPRDPVVFAGALGRIPPFTVEAGLTASLLREGARREPAAASTAAEAVVIWLESMRHRLGTFLGATVVERSARRLLGPEDPPGWRDTIEDYLGEDGPLRRAEREDAAAQEAAAAEQRALDEEIRRQRDALSAVPAREEQGHHDGEIDWDIWLADAEERLREHAQWRREHEEWLAEQKEREAEQDAFDRDLAAGIAQSNRIWTGRATQADLDDARSGVDLPNAPWPEPRPRPGEREGERTG